MLLYQILDKIVSETSFFAGFLPQNAHSAKRGIAIVCRPSVSDVHVPWVNLLD